MKHVSELQCYGLSDIQQEQRPLVASIITWSNLVSYLEYGQAPEQQIMLGTLKTLREATQGIIVTQPTEVHIQCLLLIGLEATMGWYYQKCDVCDGIQDVPWNHSFEPLVQETRRRLWLFVRSL